MRITMVSDNETFGGAAIAASRLAAGLVRRGHDVVRVVFEADGGRHPWSTVYQKQGFHLRVLRHLLSPRYWQPFAEGMMTRGVVRAIAATAPDVVNVHNIHGVFASLWRPWLVRRCADRYPTVWTMHDMWSFTGRCPYNRECRSFEAGCDSSCPTADEYPVLDPDRIAAAWQERLVCIGSDPPVTAVSPSRWLAEEAVKGLWPETFVNVIPNGIPLEIFRPMDREELRREMGIDTSLPVFVISAVDWVDQRKGGRILREALSSWSGELVLLILGIDRQVWDDCAGVRVRRMGFIDDEEQLARVLSAADAMIHPALQDNLPNVVVEAIACGTPVVAFSTGGLSDMIRPGVSGWLAERRDKDALAAAIQLAVADLKAGRTLRESCRALAEREYDLRLQAQRYETLFQRLRRLN